MRNKLLLAPAGILILAIVVFSLVVSILPADAQVTYDQRLEELNADLRLAELHAKKQFSLQQEQAAIQKASAAQKDAEAVTQEIEDFLSGRSSR